MPSRLSWSQLLPGLLAFGAVLLAAFGVLRFAGVGRIRGEKILIYALASQARGVMRGTEVWVAGQKIGLVTDITFRTPSTDSAGRLVIAMRVRKHDAEQIRVDSRPEIRAGATLISPIVVYIDAGSAESRAVKAGDTLRAGAQSDFELAGSKLARATEELGPTMTDARAVMARLHDRRGTVGAVMSEGVGGDVASVRAQMSRIRSRFGGATRRGPALMARAGSAMARVDSVRTLLASPRSSYGRFRRDSTLMRTVGALRDELTELRASFDSADGNLARLKSDSALARSIDNARAEMTLLFTDLRKRPLRYVQF